MKVVKLEDVLDILNQIEDAQENGENFISAAAEMINELSFMLPEEGLKKVIQCKDCKYQEKTFITNGYVYECKKVKEYANPCLDFDFCSRAERKYDD